MEKARVSAGHSTSGIVAERVAVIVVTVSVCTVMEITTMWAR
jgi:hypothetical protein